MFTHQRQTPLLSTTYFLLRSDTPQPPLPLPYLLFSHPSCFAPAACPYHFSLTSLTSPSLFPEQSCLSGCLYQATPFQPMGKTSSRATLPRADPVIGKKDPFPVSFVTVLSQAMPECLSTFSGGMSTPSTGSLSNLLGRPPEPLSQKPLAQSIPSGRLQEQPSSTPILVMAFYSQKASQVAQLLTPERLLRSAPG